MSLDFYIQSEISEDIMRISAIRKSCIFNKENIQHPLLKSAFIETMICLNDLMYKCKKYAIRISFVNDIVSMDKIKDITDLINYVRNAMCHLDSPYHKIDSNKFTFNIVVGKNPNAYIINGSSYGCDYEDDICFLLGKQKIYLIRHIEKAYIEAKKLLIPLLDSQFNII